jgi:hypothetical protein
MLPAIEQRMYTFRSWRFHGALGAKHSISAVEKMYSTIAMQPRLINEVFELRILYVLWCSCGCEGYLSSYQNADSRY